MNHLDTWFRHWVKKTETALTKHLFCARHWQGVFTEPEHKKEYNTIPAFGEVTLHMSVETNLYWIT